MLVRFFRQNQPGVLIALLPLLALLWPGASADWSQPFGRTAAGMPLFQALQELMRSAPWLPAVCSGVIVIGLAMQLNFTTNESEFFGRRNYLTALLLPLLLAIFPQGLAIDPALAGMPFVLWSLRRLWSTQGEQRILGALFDGGCLLGLASLCHLPYAFLIVVFWSSLAVMRPFRWREYLAVPLGTFAVLFIAWATLHLTLPGHWDPQGSLMPQGSAVPAAHPPHWLRGVLLLALGTVLLISAVVSFAAGYARGVMREKNTRASFLAFTFACALLAAFAWFTEHRVPPALVGTPLAVLLAWPLLHGRRGGLAEAGVLAVLLLGVWGRWFP